MICICVWFSSWVEQHNALPTAGAVYLWIAIWKNCLTDFSPLNKKSHGVPKWNFSLHKQVHSLQICWYIFTYFWARTYMGLENSIQCLGKLSTDKKYLGKTAAVLQQLLKDNCYKIWQNWLITKCRQYWYMDQIFIDLHINELSKRIYFLA